MRTLDDLGRRGQAGRRPRRLQRPAAGRGDHRRRADPRRAADARARCASAAPPGSCCSRTSAARRAATRARRWRPSPRALGELLGADVRAGAEPDPAAAGRRGRHGRERPLLRAGRPRTTRRWPRATPRSATSTSTTPSAPRTAPTPPTTASRGCCRAPPGCCCSARSRRSAASSRDPGRPLVAIVGGAKVTDKIGVIDAFLRARRHGAHRRRDVLPVLRRPGPRRRRLAVRGRRASSPRAARWPTAASKLRLPVDLVLGARVLAPTPRSRPLDGVDVPDGWMGLDVGPAHRARPTPR